MRREALLLGRLGRDLRVVHEEHEVVPDEAVDELLEFLERAVAYITSFVNVPWSLSWDKYGTRLGMLAGDRGRIGSATEGPRAPQHPPIARLDAEASREVGQMSFQDSPSCALKSVIEGL